MNINDKWKSNFIILQRIKTSYLFNDTAYQFAKLK